MLKKRQEELDEASPKTFYRKACFSLLYSTLAMTLLETHMQALIVSLKPWKAKCPSGWNLHTGLCKRAREAKCVR